MISKHDIMYQLYPDATGCKTNADGTLTAYKGQDELTIDQDAINTEYTKQEYKNKRIGIGGVYDNIYLPLGEQLDLLYKDIIADKLDASGEFAKAIKTTKDKYPKP